VFCELQHQSAIPSSGRLGSCTGSSPGTARRRISAFCFACCSCKCSAKLTYSKPSRAASDSVQSHGWCMHCGIRAFRAIMPDPICRTVREEAPQRPADLNLLLLCEEIGVIARKLPQVHEEVTQVRLEVGEALRPVKQHKHKPLYHRGRQMAKRRACNTSRMRLRCGAVRRVEGPQASPVARDPYRTAKGRGPGPPVQQAPTDGATTAVPTGASQPCRVCEWPRPAVVAQSSWLLV